MEAFCKTTGISFQISIDLPIKNIPIRTNIFEIGEAIKILKNIPLDKIEREIKAGFVLLIMQEIGLLSNDDKTSIRNRNIFMQEHLRDVDIPLVIRVYERKLPKGKLPQISFEDTPSLKEYFETLQRICWPPSEKKEIFEITDIVIKTTPRKRTNIKEKEETTELTDFFHQETKARTIQQVLAEKRGNKK